LKRGVNRERGAMGEVGVVDSMVGVLEVCLGDVWSSRMGVEGLVLLLVCRTGGDTGWKRRDTIE
jgi:hypothetical protein